MKEIQGKRLDKEIEILSSSDFVQKMKQVTKEEFHIDLEIPASLIKENCQMDINFLIIINNNFPLSSPKTFCKTGVSFL